MRSLLQTAAAGYAVRDSAAGPWAGFPAGMKAHGSLGILPCEVSMLPIAVCSKGLPSSDPRAIRGPNSRMLRLFDSGRSPEVAAVRVYRQLGPERVHQLVGRKTDSTVTPPCPPRQDRQTRAEMQSHTNISLATVASIRYIKDGEKEGEQGSERVHGRDWK